MSGPSDTQQRQPGSQVSNAVLAERLDANQRMTIETKCAVDNLATRFGEFIAFYGKEHEIVSTSASGAHRRIDKVESRLDKLESSIDGMERSVDRLIESNKALTKALSWIGSGIGILVLGLLWQIFLGQLQVVP